MVISLVDVKEHLKLDPADVSQDSYLTMLIWAATDYAQQHMGITLINTTYRTYRDYFTSCLELRKTPFNSLVSFEYLVNDVYTAVTASIYYIAERNAYPKIYLVDGETFPSDIDDTKNAVRIDFVAGYGADNTAIPEPMLSNIQISLLNHVARLYEMRGDCGKDNSIYNAIPSASKSIYSLYKVRNLSGRLCC
jgi:uncharacterized phiE125 gp8 family phage protein